MKVSAFSAALMFAAVQGQAAPGQSVSKTFKWDTSEINLSDVVPSTSLTITFDYFGNGRLTV